jgi:hypothetical protein
MPARFGGDLVTKKFKARTRRSINPMLLMDYRCYVEGGELGTRYDPPLAQCLRSLAAMTPRQIQDKYDFPMLRNAQILRERAKGGSVGGRGGEGGGAAGCAGGGGGGEEGFPPSSPFNPLPRLVSPRPSWPLLPHAQSLLPR